MLSPDSFVQLLSVWAVPVLLAITLHEVAHGWAARALGDPTAARLGRLSLNPLRHVDPVGTVVVPGVLLFMGGFLFGWAKPVPVNMHNLARPRQHMAWVALAGPAANLAMLVGWALLLKVALAFGAVGPWQFFALVAIAGILINLILMLLNLLPLPPLDGSRVLAGLLPEPGARWLDRIEPWGLVILIAALALGWLGLVLGPLMTAGKAAVNAVFALPPGLLR